jgi:ABC-2 type transport system permease protein
VTGASSEIVVRGVHALWRSAMWWGIGIISLAVITVAFWPSLEGSAALDSFKDMGSLLEAFGAQDIATPAGYLDGQLFALMLPLLLSGLAIAGVSGVTAGDEDGGRLEVLHALPVSRRALWLGRWASSCLVLLAVATVTALVMVISLPLFSLDEVGAGRVVGATAGCALLAALVASVAYAAAGAGASRGRAAAAAIVVLTASYVGAFLVPLADSLAGARKLSPWYWAIGQQPVTDGIDVVGLLAVVAVTALLVVLGTAAVERRDIRSP